MRASSFALLLPLALAACTGTMSTSDPAAPAAACNHPLIPDMQCLQVRELKYDDKGLKAGDPGPFGHFYAPIEGYTHEPGVRNVLRVDRYAIKDPPADAPSQAFVLDMVVESDGRGSK